MRALLRLLNRPVVAVLAVGILAAGLRFYHLSSPPTRVFDEVYYSRDACVYLGHSLKRCDLTSQADKDNINWRGEISWVHPPLGKWAIAAGEEWFGTESFGWRFSAALFGTLSVIALALIAQLLWGRPVWTFTAGLLLATEHLNFVQSRTSMLDIFLTAWVVLGFLFLALDKRWIERRTPERTVPARPDRLEGAAGEAAAMELQRSGFREVGGGDAWEASGRGPRAPSPFWRPWRLAAGLALGAAISTKWSGAYAVLAAGLLTLLWEVTRRRRAGVRHPIGKTILWESFGVLVLLVVVPLVVYVGSYWAWFGEHGFHPVEWFRLQGDMLGYHARLNTIDPKSHEPIHPYLSQWWKWILMTRPVAYFYRNPGREILGMGNPVIFWGSLVAIPWCAVAWWRKRDWRAGLVVVTILGQYLPWALAKRPLFFFYVTPITPFFVLAFVYVLVQMSEFRFRIRAAEPAAALEPTYTRARPFLPVAVGLVVAAVLLFVFFYPVLVGWNLSRDAWELRMWFGSWI